MAKHTFQKQLIVLCIISVKSFLSENLRCETAFECANTSISLTNDTAAVLQCEGYFSCSEAPTIETISQNTQIECNGAYSCYKGNVIKHSTTTTLNTSYTQCYGLYVSDKHFCKKLELYFSIHFLFYSIFV